MKKTTPKIIKTKERGKNYALWYYFRYFPSNKRLIEKLNIKTEDNNELVQEIYTEIKHLLQEEEIIRTKISNYINKNKNKSYIKNNLRQKLFNQETIERLLTDEFTPES
jgi:SOS response regulatory protein OraA/RecX